MRILLTGKNGQLGWELHRQLERDYQVLALGREDIDFQDLRFLSQILRQLPRFDFIVNAAGYTDVDQAEYEPFIAEMINSEAVSLLAEEANRRDVPMIHFSTDYVFDGEQWTRPYRENDRPNPLSSYGSSKLDGELRIRDILEKHWIFRLSGLYGIRRKNFFMTMLQMNCNGITPRIANDQVISPNWTPLIAEAVTCAMRRQFRGEHFPWGIYHLTGAGQTTWYEFARFIMEKINDSWGLEMPLPVSVSTQESGATAIRPKYSVLDPTLFNTVFQKPLPTWREQFLRFFGECGQGSVERASCPIF